MKHGVWLGALTASIVVPVAAFAQDTVSSAPIIKRVVVQGVTVFRPEKVTGFVEGYAVGKSADTDTIRTIVGTITSAYRRQGYSIAQVVSSDISPDGTLTIVVAEGTIRRVIVKGNSNTSASVIRSAVALKSGDVYKDGDVRDARTRLARLGIFDDIVVVGALETEKDEKATEEKNSAEKDSDKKDAEEEKKPLSDDMPTPETPVPDEVGYVDLIVSIKERKTGNIAATVGYNDGTGLLGFVDFSEDNLYGSSHRASIQWQRTSTARFTSNGDFIPGRTREAYLVSYDVPALGPKSTAIGASVYNTNTIFLPFFTNNQDNLRNYELRRGGKVRVGRAISRTGTVYLTARRDEVGYDPVPDSLNPPLDDLLNSGATIAALGITLQADGRDDANNPRRGYLHSLSYERAARIVGGNREYNGLQADLRTYTPLGNRPQSPMLALRLLGGVVGDNAPLSEQFWFGGYELLRGYDLYSIYGTRAFLTTAEFRVPFGAGLQGVVFTDIGNAYRSGQSIDFGNIKGSGGLGLRFLTPIGPIRFDVAYGNRFQTYVSLGQSY